MAIMYTVLVSSYKTHMVDRIDVALFPSLQVT